MQADHAHTFGKKQKKNEIIEEQQQQQKKNQIYNVCIPLEKDTSKQKKNERKKNHIPYMKWQNSLVERVESVESRKTTSLWNIANQKWNRK